MKNKVHVCDLYEASYYLLHGCEISLIKGQKVGDQLTCQITLEGDNLGALQREYFQGTCTANLFQFRRVYTQLLTWVNEAKRKFKKELREEEEKGEKKGEEKALVKGERGVA